MATDKNRLSASDCLRVLRRYSKFIRSPYDEAFDTMVTTTVEATFDRLENELHQVRCLLAEHQTTHWPRVRDLPMGEQEAFRKALNGQTVPLINGLPHEEQDAYYPWDYERWKKGLPVID